MRTNRRTIGSIAIAAAAGGAMFLPASQARAVLSGATTYTNLLAGATVTDFGIIGHPEITMTDNGAMSNALNGGFSYQYGGSNANKYTTHNASYDAFFKWGLPTGDFTARTLISTQNGTYLGGTGFTTNSPYQLSINSGPAGAFVDVTGHNSAGLPSESPFTITNHPAGITGTTAQIIFDGLYHTDGLGFAVTEELIAVEDALERIDIVSATASSTLGGYNKDWAFDDQSHLGWAAATANPGETITLTLAEPSDIDAILITGQDSRPEEFDISFNGGPATVTGASWAGAHNSIFLKLDEVATNVSTITLTMTNSPNGGANVHWVGEVIPFAIIPIPEPASAGVVGIAATALLARRRRSRS